MNNLHHGADCFCHTSVNLYECSIFLSQLNSLFLVQVEYYDSLFLSMSKEETVVIDGEPPAIDISTLHGYENLEAIFDLKSLNKRVYGTAKKPHQLKATFEGYIDHLPSTALFQDLEKKGVDGLQGLAGSDETKLLSLCFEHPGRFEVRPMHAHTMQSVFDFKQASKLGMLQYPDEEQLSKLERKKMKKEKKKRKRELQDSQPEAGVEQWDQRKSQRIHTPYA